VNVLARLRAALAAARVKRPEITEEASEEVLQQILAALGGEQVIMPKTTQGRSGRPSLPISAQRSAFKAMLGPGQVTDIVKSTGVSRSTLYRLMKRGPATGDD